MVEGTRREHVQLVQQWLLAVMGTPSGLLPWQAADYAMASQPLQVVGSEQKTATALEPWMNGVWARLKRYASLSLRLDYEHDRDTSIDRRSSSVSLLPGCPPDSHVVIKDRLGMGGEETVILLPRPLCSQG